jgi:hypothetical protein
MLQFVIKTTQDEYLSSANQSNFMSIYETVYPVVDNNSLIKLIRLLFNKNNYYDVIGKLKYNFIYDVIDINRTAMYTIINIFKNCFDICTHQVDKTWIVGNKCDARDRIHLFKQLLGEKYKLPYKYPKKDTLISFNGIDWFCNYSTYIFDIMKRKKNGIYVVDTSFMNKYETKPNCMSVGCKAYFELRSSGFFLTSIKYNNVVYLRNQYKSLSDGYFALYAFYTSVVYITTINYHLVQTHLLASANIAHNTRSLLSETNPLRHVLLPTEWITIHNQMGALILLVCETNNSQLCNFSCLTDNGIKHMIKNFVVESEYAHLKRAGRDFMPWLNLTDDEKQYTPFYTLHKYHTMFRNFSDSFVNQLHNDDLIDDNVIVWLNGVFPEYNKYGINESIKRIITNAYYMQVKHTLLSPPGFNYILPKYPPLIQRLDGHYCYDYESFINMLFIMSESSYELPKITLDCSFLIKNNVKLKAIYKQLYSDINELDSSYNADGKHNPYLKPSFIKISCGS